MTTFRIKTSATIIGIHEHTRTRIGRKDPTDPTGQTVIIDTMSLGWFIHLDFNDDGIGEVSFCVGEKPEGFEPGDRITLAFEKVSEI